MNLLLSSSNCSVQRAIVKSIMDFPNFCFSFQGLLRTRIQHRLRYILEVVRPVPTVVLDILHILTHIARHSSEACSQVNLPLCGSSIMVEKGLKKGKKEAGEVMAQRLDKRVCFAYLCNCIVSYLWCLLFLCSCLTVLGWLRPLSGNSSLLIGIPKWLNPGVYLPASMELLVPLQ